jgi:basic membrane lipoprotein Med (substrate-binding protein (PBP1-ABC) superfamily)
MSKDLFDPKASIEDNIISLSQGNPGAVTVLTSAVKRDKSEAVMLFNDLADMNMYGPRIWLGYKDYSGEDLDAFIDAVRSQEEEMVELINEMRHRGEPVNTIR